MENLIIKYLNKETTEEEAIQLKTWRMESAENEAFFQETERLWQLTSADNSIVIDTDKAWERFHKDNIVPAKIIPLWKQTWLRVAVSLLLIIGVITITKIIMDPYKHIYSQDETLTITLPDNSKITLNKNTSLDYQKSFHDNRKVVLNGEAFFWVTKDDKHPFTIETENGKIQVVGTSFNIDSDNDKTLVSVKTGKVSLSNSKSQTYLLPGEQGLASKNTDAIVTTKMQDSVYDYYITHKINCINTSIADLATILEKSFHIKVIFQNKTIAQKAITAEFPDNNLDLIIEVIERTLDVKITLKEKKLFIGQ